MSIKYIKKCVAHERLDLLIELDFNMRNIFHKVIETDRLPNLKYLCSIDQLVNDDRLLNDRGNIVAFAARQERLEILEYLLSIDRFFFDILERLKVEVPYLEKPNMVKSIGIDIKNKDKRVLKLVLYTIEKAISIGKIERPSNFLSYTQDKIVTEYLENPKIVNKWTLDFFPKERNATVVYFFYLLIQNGILYIKKKKVQKLNSSAFFVG